MLHTCEHDVPDKHEHIVVLPRNTTEFWWEPSMRIPKSFHKSGLALMQELFLLEQTSQWLGVLGDTHGMEVASLSNNSILRTCMTDLG